MLGRDLRPAPAVGAGVAHLRPLQLLKQPAQRGHGPQTGTRISIARSGCESGRFSHLVNLGWQHALCQPVLTQLRRKWSVLRTAEMLLQGVGPSPRGLRPALAGQLAVIERRFSRHRTRAEKGALHTDLCRAVEGSELFLLYQPLFSLETQLLTGVEALVRWRHPKRGVVPPDKVRYRIRSTFRNMFQCWDGGQQAR